MVHLEDYGTYETAWCPGCGNHSILKAVKQALVASQLPPSQILFVSGIGQAAKTPHYLNVNLFDGLHGRSLPVATGVKLANPKMTVIVESGDGCNYGEGGNHFLAAIRRNIDVTLLVHNNQVYGLTKGQASPTSETGFVTKAQPSGVASSSFNPVSCRRGHESRVRRPGLFRDGGSPGSIDPAGDRPSGLFPHRHPSALRIFQQGEYLHLVQKPLPGAAAGLRSYRLDGGDPESRRVGRDHPHWNHLPELKTPIRREFSVSAAGTAGRAGFGPQGLR